MDYEINWSPTSHADFSAIIRYLDAHSPAGAEIVREAINEQVARLTQFPYSGSVYQRDRTGRTREVICKSYRIFYRVEESGRRVSILSIHHGSRREPRLPNE